MKKNFMVLVAFIIFSAGTYCDIYFMWGVDNGYANMAGNGGYYFSTFFDTQYYPFDGPIGLGLDLKLKFPFIHYRDYEYQYRYRDRYNVDEIRTNKMDLFGVLGVGTDFIIAPTLSLRLSHKDHKRNIYPVLKLYPVFAYSKHNEFSFLQLLDKSNSYKTISEPYIGGGAEICFNWTKLEEYPRGGG